MEYKLALIALSTIPQVGRVAVRRVADAAGPGADFAQLLHTLGDVYPRRKEHFSRIDPAPHMEMAEAILASVEEEGQEVILHTDQRYPFRLKQTKDLAPAFVYAKNGLILDGSIPQISFLASGKLHSKSKGILRTFYEMCKQGTVQLILGLGDPAATEIMHMMHEEQEVPSCLWFTPGGIGKSPSDANADAHDFILNKSNLYSEHVPGADVSSHGAVERDTLCLLSSTQVYVLESPYNGKARRILDLATRNGVQIKYPKGILDWSEAAQFVHISGVGKPEVL